MAEGRVSHPKVWDRWVQDPYFQYFTGEEFFQHELPHERSAMSHWRKRIGGKLDILLQETLRLSLPDEYSPNVPFENSPVLRAEAPG